MTRWPYGAETVSNLDSTSAPTLTKSEPKSTNRGVFTNRTFIRYDTFADTSTLLSFAYHFNLVLA